MPLDSATSAQESFWAFRCFLYIPPVLFHPAWLLYPSASIRAVKLVNPTFHQSEAKGPIGSISSTPWRGPSQRFHSFLKFKFFAVVGWVVWFVSEPPIRYDLSRFDFLSLNVK